MSRHIRRVPPSLWTLSVSCTEEPLICCYCILTHSPIWCFNTVRGGRGKCHRPHLELKWENYEVNIQKEKNQLQMLMLLINPWPPLTLLDTKTLHVQPFTEISSLISTSISTLSPTQKNVRTRLQPSLFFYLSFMIKINSQMIYDL